MTSRPGRARGGIGSRSQRVAVACGRRQTASSCSSRSYASSAVRRSALPLGVGDLFDCAFCLTDGVSMVHRAGKIGVRKCNATVRATTQDVTRGGLAVHAKEKPWLRIHVRVTPPIQDDPGNIAPRLEAARREHVGELLAKRALVLRERRA